MGRNGHRRKFTEGLLDNELILASLEIHPGQNILDAGCGNGYMSKLFVAKVRPGGRVYALDPDEYLVKILESETRGTNIETLVADITRRTPLEPASIDLVYLSTVIHAFSERQIKGFVHEATRILRPGGKLAIVEIEKKETPFGPPLNIRYSPAELKQAIPWTALETVQVAKYFYMQIFTSKEKK